MKKESVIIDGKEVEIVTEVNKEDIMFDYEINESDLESTMDLTNELEKTMEFDINE